MTAWEQIFEHKLCFKPNEGNTTHALLDMYYIFLKGSAKLANVKLTLSTEGFQKSCDNVGSQNNGQGAGPADKSCLLSNIAGFVFVRPELNSTMLCKPPSKLEGTDHSSVTWDSY